MEKPRRNPSQPQTALLSGGGGAIGCRCAPVALPILGAWRSSRRSARSLFVLFELRKNRSHGETEKKARNVATRYAPCGVVRIWGPVPAIPKLVTSPIAQARRATTGHHQRRGVPLEKLTRTKPSPAPFTKSPCCPPVSIKASPWPRRFLIPFPPPFPSFSLHSGNDNGCWCRSKQRVHLGLCPPHRPQQEVVQQQEVSMTFSLTF